MVSLRLCPFKVIRSAQAHFPPRRLKWDALQPMCVSLELGDELGHRPGLWGRKQKKLRVWSGEGGL